MPTRCNCEFLLQILLLAQHVSGTIMPIIRSSRVLYKWFLPVAFGAWFSSCRCSVELRVVCPVCGLQLYWSSLLTIWMTYMPKWITKTKISLIYGPVCCSLAGEKLPKNGKIVIFSPELYYQCPTTWLQNNHDIQTLFLQATCNKKLFLRLITCCHDATLLNIHFLDVHVLHFTTESWHRVSHVTEVKYFQKCGFDLNQSKWW
jgi:hypothetical protein